MKIEYTEGCTCFGLDVDGVPFEDLKEYKKKIILNKVINAILEEFDTQNIIIDLLHDYGEYKYLSHCDECGDNICTYTIEV